MQPKKRYHGSLELHLQIFVPYYSEYKVNITMNADFELNWRKILNIGSYLASILNKDSDLASKMHCISFEKLFGILQNLLILPFLVLKFLQFESFKLDLVQLGVSLFIKQLPPLLQFLFCHLQFGLQILHLLKTIQYIVYSILYI